jgi:hypothetical protein
MDCLIFTGGIDTVRRSARISVPASNGWGFAVRGRRSGRIEVHSITDEQEIVIAMQTSEVLHRLRDGVDPFEWLPG